MTDDKNLSVRGGGFPLWTWLKKRPAVAVALGAFTILSVVGIILSECGG